jgi:hypothetical protein
MKQYQRALFWKHLFPFVWPGAQPSAQAEATAMERAEGCTGAAASEWLRMGQSAVDDDEDDEPLSKRMKVSEA